ncbi:carbohydrate ABC transporter permease [Meiothermus ruber]|uniref:Binding-protein-dependent transport system inner membrane protein n=1 Tax=Meiothermus ruber (strain ATCC 35948 / DSM 1279 / VKM B-1258 / 21) TaxID=504728 RepID=D3PNK7_MEIRD|nr:sugar ABC transporter permease [Meiothermus ruber]GIW39223.1 MAG: ABC transporter permease [Meiothermus sp.]ADD27398.1 binding-protein-dependent transport systems inner membrane component [Meiothermus ruber DSM 1279]AGK03863.1 binding-protein-dependent transport system inner membrane protein [Meiothermus ruber DSM 1279]MCL6531024.1 sugar ABC transporter permease [Meiothermus ruber]GAO74325.1 binding-protein-dependent transport system inner membrane protein [Meiothermus ruber H328]
MLRSRRTEALYALLFLAPFLIHLGIFFVFAFVRTVGFSFTDATLIGQSSRFVGFANFVELFREPRFLAAFTHSISFMLVVTTLQTFLALVLAAVLNQRLRGITFFRTVYYIPSVLSSAAVTVIAIWFFQKTGFLNTFIGYIGSVAPVLLVFGGLFVLAQAVQVGWERWRGVPVPWLDPALATISLVVALALTWGLVGLGVVRPLEARPPEFTWLTNPDRFLGIPIPLWSIVILNTFTTIPTLMLIFLAGLQDIPKSLYEAASIDGASPVQQFFSVTVPMLRPVTFLVITLSLIGTLQMFDQVALMGDAAPLDSIIVLAYYVYNNVFSGEGQVGLASAAALILAGLTFAIVLLQRALGISEKAH